jgi:hypothetical protein
MGQAAVECVSGCACSSIQLDGHNKEHNSQLHLHKMEVTQAEVCVVRFTGMGALIAAMFNCVQSLVVFNACMTHM